MNFHQIKRIPRHFFIILSLLLTTGVVGIFFLASNFLYQNQPTLPAQNNLSKTTVLGLATTEPIPTASSSALPSISGIKKSSIKPFATPHTSVFPSPTTSSNPSSTPVSNTSSTSSNNQSTPVSTNIPSSSPLPSPTPFLSASASATLEPSSSPMIDNVSVEVKQPDTDLQFTIEITDGMNVCQVMQKAKDEGKIASLTLNDKYLSSFNTLLVSEINGYQNNWIFTINGESPNGCSLVIVKNNDNIVWEFLNS